MPDKISIHLRHFYRPALRYHGYHLGRHRLPTEILGANPTLRFPPPLSANSALKPSVSNQAISRLSFARENINCKLC